MRKNYDMGHANIKLAGLFCVIAAFSASIMVLFVKLAAPGTTNSMTIFFRFLVSFLYSVIIICHGRVIRRKPFPLAVHRLWLHAVRAVFGLGSMLCLYYALRFIPLMDGTLLSMTNPLFIPLIALLLFGIKTKHKVVAAIVVGFLGVLLVIRPGYGMVNPHAIYALGSGVSAAFSIVLLRELAKHDKPQTIMFYYFLFALILSSIIAAFDWQMPNAHTLLLLLGVGIFGTFYQEFLIRASALAPAPIISVCLYTFVVFSGILDYLVWGLKPDLLSCMGLLIICVSSYFVTKSK